MEYYTASRMENSDSMRMNVTNKVTGERSQTQKRMSMYIKLKSRPN